MRKIHFWSLLLVAVFLGCEEEPLKRPSDGDYELKASILTKKEVIDQNQQVKTFLNKFEGGIKTYLKSSNNSNGSTESFEILEDQVKYLEFQNYHSYTFGIQRNNTKYNLENLLLSLKQDGSYESYLVLYDITESEKKLLMEGRELDLSDKIYYQKISFDPGQFFNKTSNTLEGAINECPSGNCCEIRKGESGATGWEIYETIIVDCPDDQPSNGGGTGGGSTNPEPTDPGGDPNYTGGTTQGYVNQQGNFVTNLTSPVTTLEDPTYPDGSTTASEFLINSLYPVSTVQTQWIEDPQNNAEVAKILDFLSSEGRTAETKDFAKAAINAYLDGGEVNIINEAFHVFGNNDITWEDFDNWFLGEQTDIEQNLNINPNLITYDTPLQQQSLPSLADFMNNFPKYGLSGSYYTMPSSNVYQLVGGSLWTSHQNQPLAYNNACAIRGSRGLLYSGIHIPVLRYNGSQRTQKGGDNNNYILDAVSFDKFMRDQFGSPTFELTGTNANDLQQVANLLDGKNGIYVIINEDPQQANYSGHVDAIINGQCISNAYTTPPGGVKSIRIWELQ